MFASSACAPKPSLSSDVGHSTLISEATPSDGTAEWLRTTIGVPIRVSDWRSAARAGDWLAVAAAIDALSEEARSEPTRYVRVVAAHRLGDCECVLREGSGLEGHLPMLHTELASMVRECEFVLGVKTSDQDLNVSPDVRLKAARVATQTGDLERAHLILNELCEDRARGTRSREEILAQAHELRAQIAEQLGFAEQAERDYRWLALDRVSPGADIAYERLAGKRLASDERLTRAEKLAELGRVAEVERELDLAMSAPGKPVSRLARVRARALSHFKSRSSYHEAARLYEQASQLSSGARTSDLFRAASSWVRSGQLERGVRAYERIRRLYPRSAAEERAIYRRAQALYAAGRWDAAIKGYNDYLERYGRDVHGARFIRASHYERSVAELARGNGAAALAGFERLRRFRRMGYSSRTISLLEAVALSSSGVAAFESEAVHRFEELVRHHPVSFEAMASAARLRQVGREPPRLPESLLQIPSEPRPALPAKVQLLLELGLDTAAERALHETEAGLRAENAPRGAEISCQHYASVDRGYRQYALAAGMLGNVTLGRAPTAANMWAWRCLYPRPYSTTVEALERRYGLPQGLLHSVMRQESAFRADARSPVGAIGLMQLMPRTAELAAHEIGVEHDRDRLTRPRYNLELGAFYLRKLMDTFEHRAVLALAGYNAGPHATARWLSGGLELGADVWVARIPYEETRRYVTRVMTNWSRYRYLIGGFEQVPELSLELPPFMGLPADSY